MTRAFEVVVFDLDGVITDTARVHATAWKQLFDGFLSSRGKGEEPFHLERDYQAYVDGKPRYEGVRSFLESRGIHLEAGDPGDAGDRRTICGLGNQKDALFRRVLEDDGVVAFPSTVRLMRDLKEAGIRLGVASSSKNCERVLQRAALDSMFSARVDGVVSADLGLLGKPNPAIFVECAARLGCTPNRAVVIEDSLAGVQAGRDGGFALVVGVNRGGDAAALLVAGADVVVADLEGVGLKELGEWTERRQARESVR